VPPECLHPATTNQFVYGEPGMRYATGRISPIATALRYPRWAMTISAQVTARLANPCWPTCIHRPLKIKHRAFLHHVSFSIARSIPENGNIWSHTDTAFCLDR
jgi:hypothetical protein